MGVFVTKQPNGLYCLYSTYSDRVVGHNLTRDDYIRYKEQEAREEAERHLDRIDNGKAVGVPKFEDMIANFVPGEMDAETFVKIVREAGYEGDLSQYSNLEEVCDGNG